MNHLFGQTFTPRDLAVIGLLVVLEGVLSIDNALVLGLLARRLPDHLQKRALTYGLIGAFVFRIIAIGTAQLLLKWSWVKLAGGLYLLYIAVKHFFFESRNAPSDGSGPASGVGKSAAGVAGFWSTVAVIELTDIAFAVDSILAAIALVGAAPADAPVAGVHPKLWVVVAGGMLGVMLMRVAAVLFIRLLKRFPRFETSAYLLVIVIGAKLLVDWGFNTAEFPHRVDFHSTSDPIFWAFWGLMLGAFLIGFIPVRRATESTRQ